MTVRGLVQCIAEDVLPLKCGKLLITWNRAPKDVSIHNFFSSLYRAFYNVNILLPTSALLFNI